MRKANPNPRLTGQVQGHHGPAGVTDLLVRKDPAGLGVDALCAHDHCNRDYGPRLLIPVIERSAIESIMPHQCGRKERAMAKLLAQVISRGRNTPLRG